MKLARYLLATREFRGSSEISKFELNSRNSPPPLDSVSLSLSLDYFGITKSPSCLACFCLARVIASFSSFPFFFFLPSASRVNRCGHISGARNHQFRARKRQVKRVCLRALLKQTFCSTQLT